MRLGYRIALFFAALGMLALTAAKVRADCYSSHMEALAQIHASDMARRDHLDHKGFCEQDHGRCSHGAMAENVGIAKSQTAMMIGWRNSKPHAANLALPGCRGIASAISASGKRYWAMEFSQ